jgi:hypothetical protein
MKKTALALLLIFAAFTWACDDGLDERASFSAGYVSAYADNYTRSVDLFTTSADADGNCLPPIDRLEAIRQGVIFRVWVKPNQNSSIARIGIKTMEIKFASNTPGAPAISAKKANSNQPLYITDDESKDIKEVYEYVTTIPFPLLDSGDMKNLIAGFPGVPMTYIVDYKFKLVEYDTGIEDEVYVEGIRLSFADYIQEGECQ